MCKGDSQLLRLEESLGDSLSPRALSMSLNVFAFLSLVFGELIRIFGYPPTLASPSARVRHSGKGVFKITPSIYTVKYYFSSASDSLFPEWCTQGWGPSPSAFLPRVPWTLQHSEKPLFPECPIFGTQGSGGHSRNFASSAVVVWFQLLVLLWQTSRKEDVIHWLQLGLYDLITQKLHGSICMKFG
jgi:hypothetical protein